MKSDQGGDRGLFIERKLRNPFWECDIWAGAFI